jgi:hypothetical protein
MNGADLKAKRREYQKLYMRKRRAAKSEVKCTSDSAPTKPGERAKPVTPSPTLAKSETRAKAKPERSSKPKSERSQRREWRFNVVDFLTDCLTDPACPLTGQWYESHRIGSMWMGFYDKLNAIEATVDDKPDVLAELRLCIAIEALRRLSGERPAGTVGAALPATR